MMQSERARGKARAALMPIRQIRPNFGKLEIQKALRDTCVYCVEHVRAHDLSTNAHTCIERTRCHKAFKRVAFYTPLLGRARCKCPAEKGNCIAKLREVPHPKFAML